ncbi:acyl carrier protein, partial [Streptomyces sp. NPDC004830]
MSYAQVNSGAGRDTTSAEDVTAFLRTSVAALLDVTPESVDTGRPLRDLGLDSMRIVSLVAALAQHLGRPVPGGVVWQYPTIAALAAHLAGTAPLPAAPGTPARADDGEPIA